MKIFMSLNSCFLRDIDSSTLTTVELSRNLVRSLAEHSLSLTLSLSLRNGFPLLVFKQTLDELKTVPAADAAACVLPNLVWLPSETRFMERLGLLSSVLE